MGVCLGRKTKVQITPFSPLASTPGLLPSHTLDLVQNILVWSKTKHWDGGREGGLCVKCLLEMHCGVFSCMGNHLCQAFPCPPCSHISLIGLAASASSFASSFLSLASCAKPIFIFFSFPKSRDWAHLARLLCVWFVKPLRHVMPYLLFKKAKGILRSLKKFSRVQCSFPVTRPNCSSVPCSVCFSLFLSSFSLT